MTEILLPSFVTAHPPGTMTLVIDPATRCILEMFSEECALSRLHGLKVTALSRPELESWERETAALLGKLIGKLLDGTEPSYERQLTLQIVSTLGLLFVSLRCIRDEVMCPDGIDLEDHDTSKIRFDIAHSPEGKPILN